MNIVCVQTFPIDYCIDYVNTISRLGRVTLIAAEDQVKPLQDFISPDIGTVLLRWPRHRSPANLRLMYQLSQAIREEQADLVHFLGDSVSWLSLMPKLIGPRPTVITVHDANVHPGDTRSQVVPTGVVDLFHRQATRLVVHGEVIRRQLAARSGRPAGDIDIVPHVALNRYPEIARRAGLGPKPDDSRFRLLFFGRMMHYKGLPFLLDALDALIGDLPELELVIAGEGPGYDEVGSRIEAEHVRLHRGFIPELEAASMFLETDLVVLPYVEASQSGILAMAAAFGKPVLVTDVGELGEVTRATGMGLVVPLGDSAALAAAIRRIHGEPALRQTLERQSAAAASDGPLSPGRVAAAARTAYERALAGTEAAAVGGR
jgi:glycosyltransferase involved in cell wall biosynthesis